MLAGDPCTGRNSHNLLLVALVRQHVGAHGTGHESTNRAQDAAAELVTEEGTASASDQRGTKATLTIRGATGTSGNALLRLAILIMLAVLPLVLLDLLVLSVALVAVTLLLRRAIRLLLVLLWRVGRVGAVLVV